MTPSLPIHWLLTPQHVKNRFNSTTTSRRLSKLLHVSLPPHPLHPKPPNVRRRQPTLGYQLLHLASHPLLPCLRLFKLHKHQVPRPRRRSNRIPLHQHATHVLKPPESHKPPDAAQVLRQPLGKPQQELGLTARDRIKRNTSQSEILLRGRVGGGRRQRARGRRRRQLGVEADVECGVSVDSVHEGLGRRRVGHGCEGGVRGVG